MVFLYFGVLATAGTAFVHAESVPAAAWWSSAALGFLAVAILVANNLRDIETDAAAGRRTLAVRLGDRRTRALYRACVVAAFLVVALGVIAEAIDDGIGITPWALLAFGALPVVIRQIIAIAGAQGRALIGVLVGTAALQVVFGVLLAAGLWIGRT
jgi:1,4-dihydroxy-2-naphthoate octaprenyltransferase